MDEKFTSQQLEDELMIVVENIVSQKVTMIQPGSISYLLYGRTPSSHSIFIKLGKLGETIAKKFISNSNSLELLQCIDAGINKDLDLIWKDDEKKLFTIVK